MSFTDSSINISFQYKNYFSGIEYIQSFALFANIFLRSLMVLLAIQTGIVFPLTFVFIQDIFFYNLLISLSKTIDHRLESFETVHKQRN